jgi:hypothetical protein
MVGPIRLGVSGILGAWVLAQPEASPCEGLLSDLVFAVEKISSTVGGSLHGSLAGMKGGGIGLVGRFPQTQFVSASEIHGMHPGPGKMGGATPVPPLGGCDC